MRKITALLAALIFAVTTFTAGCGTDISSITGTSMQSEVGDTEETSETQADTADSSSSETSVINLSDIPEYSGDIYVEVNGNIPFFTEDEKLTTDAFETYSELDSLGRCGVAYANICQELMPTEERESISDVYPTGWNNNSYDFVDSQWCQNRCHLIGFQLAGENANELNLIAGTRSLNVDGMLVFENMVADYVKETDNHVLYRVTPMFEGDNLMASGVLMEGWSVEDQGDGICFCTYVYNVEPGVIFNYATGENWAEDDYTAESADVEEESTGDSSETSEESEEMTYVLNTNTMKFHDPDCSSVADISESNKEEYTGTREDLINEGYSPCGNCKP